MRRWRRASIPIWPSFPILRTNFLWISPPPGIPKAVVRSRVIMTPVNAKRLLRALQDNVSKYEEQFGVIQDRPNQMPPFMSGGGLA